MKKTNKDSKSTQSSFSRKEVDKIVEGFIDMAIQKACERYEDEIWKLKRENSKLKRRLAVLETPPKRGRPLKKKRVSTLGEALGLALGMNPKRTGGRPTKYRNAGEKIAKWDDARAQIAKDCGKKSVTDLYLINYIINNDKTLSRNQKTESRKEIRSVIKQLRDKSGVRIHRRKKAENPSV